ncbi:hypothetical protein B0I35DRAFT_444403 [Stachybotrys elegans]|uniref:Uncharacterized protein n=1 Tax=Stachybotrys elegans TaxID=80388 RepID=A0A8K0WLQ0_9HYPO|nr:hypothetical protein B0I35DRAFT_444403 [Stachybotrys elegans]
MAPPFHPKAPLEHPFPYYDPAAVNGSTCLPAVQAPQLGNQFVLALRELRAEERMKTASRNTSVPASEDASSPRSSPQASASPQPAPAPVPSVPIQETPATAPVQTTPSPQRLPTASPVSPIQEDLLMEMELQDWSGGQSAAAPATLMQSVEQRASPEAMVLVETSSPSPASLPAEHTSSAIVESPLPMPVPMNADPVLHSGAWTQAPTSAVEMQSMPVSTAPPFCVTSPAQLASVWKQPVEEWPQAAASMPFNYVPHEQLNAWETVDPSELSAMPCISEPPVYPSAGLYVPFTNDLGGQLAAFDASSMPVQSAPVMDFGSWFELNAMHFSETNDMQ